MIKTILVPTDFSEHAQRSFERAFDLAGELGSKLYLLHVQTESALRTAIREGLFGDSSTDEELREAVSQLIEERFSKTMSGIDRSQVSIEHTSRRGDADYVIPSYAEEIGADLVVVGRRGAGLVSEMRAVVIGSVTESIIKKSPCPVLVVRREHFWKK
ncbi:MAG TPA: universal stress protein [Blastocatellia bacterium]|nr:universal stress protein [Blastocatellia bacterium]